MAGALTELLVEDCGVGEMRLLSRALRELTTIEVPFCRLPVAPLEALSGGVSRVGHCDRQVVLGQDA